MSDIKGYTKPSDEKVQQVNVNKLAEELVLRLVDEHAANESNDGRFVQMARTHIQSGFMFLNRAVMQPKRIDDDISAEAVFLSVEDKR